MDNLQLSPAKLFYFITELSKKGLIDEKERIQLKELVISDDPSVYQYLEQYETQQSEKELTENLLSRVRFNARYKDSWSETKRSQHKDSDKNRLEISNNSSRQNL